jgi:hypothetical protein
MVRSAGKTADRRWLALAGLFNFENFAVLIVPAFGADVVRALALVAVGALGKGAGGDGIVGAADGGAPFGMAALWVRHGGILSRLPRGQAL